MAKKLKCAICKKVGEMPKEYSGTLKYIRGKPICKACQKELLKGEVEDVKSEIIKIESMDMAKKQVKKVVKKEGPKVEAKKEEDVVEEEQVEEPVETDLPEPAAENAPSEFEF